MNFLSFFRFAGNTKKALKRGGIIIDVRTGQEFDLGHIPEALHIPLDRIRLNTARIKAMNRPVILCCNSGTRSGKALAIFKEEGLKEVYNGGNWERLLKIVNSL